MLELCHVTAIEIESRKGEEKISARTAPGWPARSEARQ